MYSTFYTMAPFFKRFVNFSVTNELLIAAHRKGSWHGRLGRSRNEFYGKTLYDCANDPWICSRQVQLVNCSASLAPCFTVAGKKFAYNDFRRAGQLDMALNSFARIFQSLILLSFCHFALFSFAEKNQKKTF